MGKYSKLIAAVVGVLIGALVAWGVLPGDWNTPDNINSLVTAIGTIIALCTAIATYFAPKNKE